MPDGAAGASRPKKTKLEKISELEASLKLAKEEIHLHKKEIDRLKKGGGSESSSKTLSQDDQEKLKFALKAMKRVTVKQEMNLQQMRESASDRRRSIKERDETIAALKQRLLSMDKTIKSMEQGSSSNKSSKNNNNNNNSSDNSQARIRKLEKKCYDEENKNMELRQKLERAEARIKQLVERKGEDSVGGGQRGGGDVPSFNSSNQSIGSTLSSEADLAKMRQELTRKSTKICNLEYELEVAKDELVGLKKQAQGHNSFTGHDSMHASFAIGEDGFPTAPPIGVDPFKTAAADPFGSAAMVGNSSLFSDSESEEEEESDFDD